MRLHAEPEALAITRVGIEDARPAPGVVEAIDAAELDLVAPSNPVVSIGPILAVPGHPRRRCGRRRRRWSGSPGSSAAPRCSAWPTGCCRPSASASMPPRSACTTVRGRAAACSTPGRWTTPTQASAGLVTDGGLQVVVDRPDHARPATHRRLRRARGAARSRDDRRVMINSADGRAVHDHDLRPGRPRRGGPGSDRWPR